VTTQIVGLGVTPAAHPRPDLDAVACLRAREVTIGRLTPTGFDTDFSSSGSINHRLHRVTFATTRTYEALPAVLQPVAVVCPRIGHDFAPISPSRPPSAVARRRFGASRRPTAFDRRFHSPCLAGCENCRRQPAPPPITPSSRIGLSRLASSSASRRPRPTNPRRGPTGDASDRQFAADCARSPEGPLGSLALWFASRGLAPRGGPMYPARRAHPFSMSR
jgi:hypothetical protein